MSDVAARALNAKAKVEFPIVFERIKTECSLGAISPIVAVERLKILLRDILINLTSKGLETIEWWISQDFGDDPVPSYTPEQ